MVFYWHNTTKIRDAPELLNKYRAHGGRIIEYKVVWSMVVYAHSSSEYIWVAPGKNRILAGLVCTMACATIGWWSVPGLFWTPAALIHNLMGGVDVTGIFIRPSQPGQLVNRTQTGERRRITRVQILFFVTMTVLIIALANWPGKK